VIITDSGLKLLNKLDETERDWLKEFESIDQENTRKLNLILDTLRG
jgi:hypothetical protein